MHLAKKLEYVSNIIVTFTVFTHPQNRSYRLFWRNLFIFLVFFCSIHGKTSWDVGGERSNLSSVKNPDCACYTLLQWLKLVH